MASTLRKGGAETRGKTDSTLPTHSSRRESRDNVSRSGDRDWLTRGRRGSQGGDKGGEATGAARTAGGGGPTKKATGAGTARTARGKGATGEAAENSSPSIRSRIDWDTQR